MTGSQNKKKQPKTKIVAPTLEYLNIKKQSIIVSLVSALIGGICVAIVNGLADIKLEEKKLETQLIVQAVKTGNKQQAASNLNFLVDAGLVTDTTGKIHELIDKPENSSFVLPVPPEYISLGTTVTRTSRLFDTADYYIEDEYLTVKKADQMYLSNVWMPQTYINNDFEEKEINGDVVVFDETTKLMWERSGSDEQVNYRNAEAYIEKLNHDRFAETNDWRLPTLKEALTLLEKEKGSNGLLIAPEFDKKQKWIWVSDKVNATRGWIVGFDNGCYLSDLSYDNGYVRAVRLYKSVSKEP